MERGGCARYPAHRARVLGHSVYFAVKWRPAGDSLAPHRQAVQEFITTRQGYRLATSTGGVLTGRGADIILIDDPLDRKSVV